MDDENGTMDDENGTMDDENGTMVKKKNGAMGNVKTFFGAVSWPMKINLDNSNFHVKTLA